MNRLQNTAVLPVFMLALSSTAGPATVQAQPQGPTPVVVAPVVQQLVSATQTFVGTVMPLRLATVGSAVGGRVVQRPVEEGDRVETGQVLAQLLTDTISLQVAAADAELDLRREQLAELVNGSRPEEIVQAEARMAAAAARKEFQHSRVRRLERLSRTPSAVTEEELEEARSLALEAEQNFRDMQAAHELVLEGPRQEVIAQARAQVAIQQALVDQLRDQLNKHTVVSRFPGYVIRRHTEIGQWVSEGDPVADVAAIDEVDVVVQVVERYISHVRPGVQVQVEVPAIPDRTFTGTLVTSVPQADVRARTFPVKVRVQNEIGPDGPLLKAGMYARASLPVGEQQQALLVPKDAIVLGGPRPLVVVVQVAESQGETGSTASIPVDTGVSHGSLIQVTGNLNPGQLVVVQGNERLRPGQQVLLTRIDAASEEESSTSQSNKNG